MTDFAWVIISLGTIAYTLKRRVDNASPTYAYCKKILQVNHLEDARNQFAPRQY